MLLAYVWQRVILCHALEVSQLSDFRYTQSRYTESCSADPWLDQLPGSVAETTAPNRKQSVRRKSPSADWPARTISLVKAYAQALGERKEATWVRSTGSARHSQPISHRHNHSWASSPQSSVGNGARRWLWVTCLDSGAGCSAQAYTLRPWLATAYPMYVA